MVFTLSGRVVAGVSELCLRALWQEGHNGKNYVLTAVAASKCPLSEEAAQLMPGQFTVPPSGQKDPDANCDFRVILGDTEYPHFLSLISEHSFLRGISLQGAESTGFWDAS